MSLALVAVATVVTYWPTLRNGFLVIAFDDAIVLDTLAIRQLSWPNFRALATEFNQAHYTPFTMLSLAVDYHLWGLDPFGYHLTNVLLHAATAVLACVFLRSILPSLHTAAFAALIFALHPVQMEAVSLAIQRKTVLSGALFFLSLISYQGWRRTGKCRHYAVALAAFMTAGLAKPIVITLPLLLWFYDYVFIGGRLRLAEKLPFVFIASAVAGAAVAAHAAVGAMHPPHGGTVLAHLLMVSRVGLEYVAAVLLPANLSPIYYYPRRMAYAPLNFLALAAIVTASAYIALRRRRAPWSFFCAGWFALTLLPESNVLPLAQLRADRFLYLPMLGAAVWLAIGIERVLLAIAAGWRWPLLLYGTSLLVTAALGLATYASASVWRSDVSAWTRVVERHPWCAVAHVHLGSAYAQSGDTARAESAWQDAIRIDPQLALPHRELAKLYHGRGQDALADAHLHRLLDLAPNDPEGLALLAAMRKPGDK